MEKVLNENTLRPLVLSHETVHFDAHRKGCDPSGKPSKGPGHGGWGH